MASITINAPADKVWDAITTPEKRKQWFFGADTHTDWKVGSPIRHTGKWEGRPYEDKGKVKVFEPRKRLVHTHWSQMSGRPDTPENYETVTTTLTEKNGETEVAISEENIATEEQEAMSDKMWGQALSELKKLVEKK